MTDHEHTLAGAELEACRASVMNHFHPDSAGNRVWHLKLGRKG